MDDLMDNFDDELVNDDWDFGYTVMTDEEFVQWCVNIEEGEPYGDC